MASKTRILTVVGARPQFIKAAPLSVAFSRAGSIEERLIHTGQHYDTGLSKVFFDQMGLPRPWRTLETGSGTHASQTAAILTGIEQALLDEPADWILVYGDTNSTLAGALAAVKLHVPVAHVEAGMRSFNRRMPEEINRVVCDHLATLHLCASRVAVDNLAAEGLVERVHHVGDIMSDCVRIFGEAADRNVNVKRDFHVEPGRFVLMTCHRAENTDDPGALASIMSAIASVSKFATVLFPAHPRVVKALKEAGIESTGNVQLVAPVGYLEMLALERAAVLVITDSGGVQKEALYARTPCITLRSETEWVETVESGWNVLAGTDEQRIIEAAQTVLVSPSEAPPCPENLYGDGHTAEKIAEFFLPL